MQNIQRREKKEKKNNLTDDTSRPLQQNSEATVNNKSFHINSRLLSQHKRGNKKLNSSCAIGYSTTGSRSRVGELNRRAKDWAFSFLGGGEAVCCFVTRRLRFGYLGWEPCVNGILATLRFGLHDDALTGNAS